MNKEKAETTRRQHRSKLTANKYIYTHTHTNKSTSESVDVLVDIG
jgi:hypothetical protein